MTDESTILVLTEEWKKKCSAFSSHSTDNLPPVIGRVFDAIEVFLQGSDHNRIKLVLRSLDSERAIYSSSEATEELSIRTLMYGVIQSVHGVLIASLTPSDTKPMLAMVEEWRAKCFELWKQSDDMLVPVMAKLLDMIAMILKCSDPSRIQLELKSFENELSIRMDAERTDELSIRTLMYGIFECLHAFFLKIMKNFIATQEIQHNEAIVPKGDEVVVKEEEPMENGRGGDVGEIEQKSENGYSTILFSTEPKEELIQPEEEIQVPVDSQDSTQIGNRSSLKPSKRKSCDESGQRLHVKKSKSDSQERNEMDGATTSRPVRDRGESKLNHTELQCPQCEYRTMHVHTWYTHLRTKHATTPRIAGLALRCECGHETSSSGHSKTCSISKITIVRIRDATAKDPQATKENHEKDDEM